MNTDAINLGRSLFFGGGGGASVRYGTVRSVNAGRATVDVDGGLVEAPAMTCVPADAAGRRCVVLAEGASATVLGVLGEAPDAAPDLTDRVAALEAGLRPVSTGASGDWTYVVWSDGTSDAWSDCLLSAQAIKNVYGNAWFVSGTLAFPFAFAAAPHVQATARTEGGGLLSVSANGDTNAEQVGYYVWSPDDESSLDIHLHFHVHGAKA